MILKNVLNQQQHCVEIQNLFKKYLRESLINSQLCLEEKHSQIGIQMKEWMKWNSLKLNLNDLISEYQQYQDSKDEVEGDQSLSW
ncbi:unnamed protein product [Paramecium pentaurelia]|uniref:Uncharacterized protein n=1 Tax=Paramecium pentaurelia TaxID=43138 RepID=A0A8S1SLC4_9CILI|nr:unnamed protein product [Paramecium pentaurelia]